MAAVWRVMASSARSRSVGKSGTGVTVERSGPTAGRMTFGGAKVGVGVGVTVGVGVGVEVGVAVGVGVGDGVAVGVAVGVGVGGGGSPAQAMAKRAMAISAAMSLICASCTNRGDASRCGDDARRKYGIERLGCQAE